MRKAMAVLDRLWWICRHRFSVGLTLNPLNYHRSTLRIEAICTGVVTRGVTVSASFDRLSH